jgi:predicted DNA-binding transcriptional regulator AlpA
MNEQTRGRLLQLPEIAAMTTLSVDSLRWLRHVGRGPQTFRLGRRVVAYEADVIAWIEAQCAAEKAPAA